MLFSKHKSYDITTSQSESTFIFLNGCFGLNRNIYFYVSKNLKILDKRTKIYFHIKAMSLKYFYVT